MSSSHIIFRSRSFLAVYGKNRPSRASDMATPPHCLFRWESGFRYSCFILPTCIVSSTAPHHAPVSTTSIFKLSSSVASVTSVRAPCRLRTGESGAMGDPHSQAGRACPSPCQEQGGHGALGTAPALGIRHLPGDGDRPKPGGHWPHGWARFGDCGELETGSRD